MLDQVDGGAPGRRGIWDTGPLVRPFGRGINFQLGVDDLDHELARVAKAGAALIFGPRRGGIASEMKTSASDKRWCKTPTDISCACR